MKQYAQTPQHYVKHMMLFAFVDADLIHLCFYFAHDNKV